LFLEKEKSTLWQAISNFSYGQILAEFAPSPISNEIVDYFFIFEYSTIA